MAKIVYVYIYIPKNGESWSLKYSETYFPEPLVWLCGLYLHKSRGGQGDKWGLKCRLHLAGQDTRPWGCSPPHPPPVREPIIICTKMPIAASSPVGYTHTHTHTHVHLHTRTHRCLISNGQLKASSHWNFSLFIQWISSNDEPCMFSSIEIHCIYSTFKLWKWYL